MNHAVVRLAHILVNGHAADAVCRDMSARWVLDVLNVAADVCFHRCVFKHTVALLVEGAVLQYQIVYIAEQLLACQMTVHQSDVL